MLRRVVLMFALLLTGCSRSSDGTAGGGPADSVVAAALASRSATARGLVRVRGDAATFQPCGETRERPLVDRTGGELVRAVNALAGRPGDPVYVELRGRADSQGAAVAADAPFVALALRRASPAGESVCAQAPGRWRYRARGNEPFWSVTVWRDSLVCEEPGHTLRFMSPVAIARGDTLWWSGASARPRHRLELALFERRCTDSMSGEIASFAAIATLDGRRLEGCAIEGLDAAAGDAAGGAPQ